MKKLLLFFVLLMAAAPAYGQDRSQMLGTKNSTATIGTGNTFQTVLAAANAATRRNSLTIQNNNASDNCWITFGTLANGTAITQANASKANSILLLPGGAFTRYYPYVPSDEIEATCATTNDTLYIDTQ